MRYAIYFTPAHSDPLARAAARWLGRDAFTGASVEQQAVDPMSAAEIAFHTAAARRYGFHATLKAPFTLADGADENALIGALDRFASRAQPVTLPRIAARQLDGFFALVPQDGSEALRALAGDVVRQFEPFRAPLGEAELARRNPDSLSPMQLKYLHQWGYPYVFDEFRFHMTLTGRVGAHEAAKVAGAIGAFFGPLLDEPLEIASLALFVEPEPGAPFTIRSFHEIGRDSARKTA